MGACAVRTCSACLQEKTGDQFYRRRNGRLRAECKACTGRRSERDRLRRLSGELPVVTPKEKLCKKCQRVKPASAFHRHAAKPDGLHVTCKACRAGITRMEKYNLSEEEFTAFLVQQNGLCAICGDQMRRPAVDHCHEGGQVRGLLCSPCNTGLGHFKDDPIRLQAAINYLA